MTGVITPERAHAHAPGGVSRRGILRTAAWATPVVLVAAAAPAYAASPAVPPLTITATPLGSGGNSNKLKLTFSGGTGVLIIGPAQLNGRSITVTPTAGIPANGGIASGNGQSYEPGGAYTITYTYQARTYTVSVIGT